jgi:hypothetical protein
VDVVLRENKVLHVISELRGVKTGCEKVLQERLKKPCLAAARFTLAAWYVPCAGFSIAEVNSAAGPPV